MGLDAYIFAEKVEPFGQDDKGFDVELRRVKEIGYWRKDYELHNAMFALSYCRDPGEFNCVKVYLEPDDVHKFLMMGYEEFATAKEWQERGYKIYYDSWW